MSNIHKDRAELKRLVESYGKTDVLKYVNHVDESRQDDLDAIQKCVSQISDLAGGLSEDILAKIYQILEDFLDTVQNEPYELGRKEAESDFEDELDEARRVAYDNGKKNGYYNGYIHATGRMKRALQSIRGRDMFGNRISINRAIDLVDDVAANVEDE